MDSLRKSWVNRFSFLFLILFVFTLIIPMGYSASISLKEAFATEAPASAGGEHAKGEEGKKVEGEKSQYKPASKLKVEDYPIVKGFNSRIAVWIVAQLHLFFGAFVLAVPIFVLVFEGIGITTKDERYDHIAHEIMKVSMTAFSFTALSGGLLTFFLITLYPDFTKYLMRLFQPTVIFYVLAFIAEALFCYTYYYCWDALRYGTKKWIHLTLGLLLNVSGMTILFIANAWTGFMMTPVGVDAAGTPVSDTVWAVIRNPLWNPLNLHRFIANLAYGGAIVGAYAAYKFLSSATPEEKAHYEWLGHTANLIAISTLLPLPFAGYILMAEIYAYSQQMGITAMGGIFAWLF